MEVARLVPAAAHYRAPRRRIIEHRREFSRFADDPRGYALETGRMAEELQNYTFPPWRWREWYRRRRIVERRLAYLRAGRSVDQAAAAEQASQGGESPEPRA